MKRRFHRESLGDRIFLAFVYASLFVATIVVVYPLLYIVSASFSSTKAVITGKVWILPVEPTLLGYKTIFESKSIMGGYANSFLYTIVGTAVNVVVTVIAAYPMSLKDFYGRKTLMGLFLFTMIFSGGLIPSFLLVKQIGIYDSLWALVLPGAMSVWNMILVRTYFQSSIPKELHDSAEIDGCSDLRFLLRIALPLSRPILAVITLYYAVGHWNSYFNALVFLKSPVKFPLQMVLRNILIMNQMDQNLVSDLHLLESMRGLSELLRYAVIVVASVPLLMLYPFIQKHFVKGVMIGSLKG